MTRTFLEEVEYHFAEIAGLPATQQEHYLDHFLADQPSLQAEVRSLVKAHREGASFLQHEPERLGPYRLLEQIGRGGMGSIYRAERDDGQFRQVVAIKMLRPPVPARLLRRFLDERQILARLAHPNIARLLDGGVSPSGLPYIVMELVEGKTIAEYCRAKSRTETLRLFQQVCSAVSYAHRNLVVHRDLKPANILVTSDGAPKLLDFGIAKIMEAAPNGTTALALTPEYASPEQARGEAISTASDVYSLGVLLHELLTGRRPQPAAESREQHAVVKPATGSEDLDAIVLKALRRDSQDRYTSVDALSEDISRFFAGRPLAAREPTGWYRLSKFVRRNRASVFLAAGVTTALIVAAFLTIRQARIAERRFDVVRHLASTTLFRIHDSVAALPGSTPSRNLIVQSALEALDRLTVDAADDAGLKLELADAYQKLGDVQGNLSQSNLGDSRAALSSYAKSRRILDEVLSKDGGNEHGMRSWVRVNQNSARAEMWMRNPSEAQKLGRETVAMAEKLASQFPGEPSEEELAAAYNTLGDLGDNAYRLKALRIYEALLGRKPEDTNRQRNVALLHKNIASSYLDTKESEQAVPHLRRALELDEARVRIQPKNRLAQLDLSFDHSQFGTYYMGRKQVDEALNEFRKALEIRQSLHESDPTDARLKDRLAYLHARIGRILMDEGRNLEAIPSLQAAVQMNRSLIQIDPVNPHYRGNLARSSLSLAQSALRAGKRGVGCAALNSALDEYRLLRTSAKITESELKDIEQAEALSKGCITSNGPI